MVAVLGAAGELVRTLRSGESFGEAGLLDGLQRTASVGAHVTRDARPCDTDSA